MSMQNNLDLDTMDNSALSRQITVADAVLLMLMTAGGILRFFKLGALPLSPAESGEALSVWQFWQSSAETATSVSPAYFTLTGLFTEFVGYSDAVMRFVPALFGLGAVVIPWLWRSRMGNVGALIMSAMVAFSPIHTVLSRTSGGEAIAIFAIMLLLTAWVRFHETGDVRWLYVLSAAIGLGLTSSPLFITGAAALAAAWLVQRIAGPALGQDLEFKSIDSQAKRQAAMVAVVAVVLFGAMGLLRPEGLGAAAGLPAAWLQQFGIGSAATGILDPVLATIRYEIWLLLPGLGAIIWAALQDRPLDIFCVYWLVAAVIFSLLQPAQVSNAAIITLPAYFLVAQGGRALALPRIDNLGWGLGGVIFLLAGIAAVNVARYSRAVVYNPQQLSFLGIAMIAMIIAAASIYFAGLWKARSSFQGAQIGLFALLLVYQWGNSYWLGHFGANDPRERFVVSGSDDDIRLLADVLSDVSVQTAGAEHEIEVFSIVDTPLIRWYLREFRSASFGGSVPSGWQYAAVVSPEEYNLSLSSAYSGTDFDIVRSRLPLPAGQNMLMDTVRWWLLHDSKAPMDSERVILWWRSDLMEVRR